MAPHVLLPIVDPHTTRGRGDPAASEVGDPVFMWHFSSLRQRLRFSSLEAPGSRQELCTPSASSSQEQWLSLLKAGFGTVLRSGTVDRHPDLPQA